MRMHLKLVKLMVRFAKMCVHSVVLATVWWLWVMKSLSTVWR